MSLQYFRFFSRSFLYSFFGFFFITPTMVFYLSGCSSSDKKSDTPEGAFAIAQEYDKDERYEEAIRRYQEVRNKFPYSKLAIESELAIADCYYKQESFAEAEVYYKSFRDLHPKYPKLDFVIYRTAMSYFNQLPSTIDRDLSASEEALRYYSELLTVYPQSQYAPESKEKKEAVEKMLSEKEEYIADFYFKREDYKSALGRYEDLAEKFPGRGFEPKALSRAAQCWFRLGEPDNAIKLLEDVKKRFPESSDLKSAESEIRSGRTVPR